MYLSKHDLLQMDDEWLKKLPVERLLEVSKRLLHDVKVLQDWQNQTPNNSSRTPGIQAPWDRPAEASEAGRVGEADSAEAEDETEEAGLAPSLGGEGTTASKPASSDSVKGSGKRPGKQHGSPGHGRTQKMTAKPVCTPQIFNLRWTDPVGLLAPR